MPEPEKPQLAKPLIFISHDARDAKLAEAFGKLLSNVSAGVLKSFRSSDRDGGDGFEYGAEWFPELMNGLESASDVVCLLTRRSLGGPWIPFEAGVAKGKPGRAVLGVALGVPKSEASTGPFAQLHNCGDSEDELTKLVIQLVGRIPEAKPGREAVLIHVRAFKQEVGDELARLSDSAEPTENLARTEESFVETVWTRSMPRLDLAPGETVSKLRAMVQRIRERTCDRVRRFGKSVTPSEFRVHIVLPDYSQYAKLGTYQLFLPEDLRVGDHTLDSGLKVWPGQGVAGRVFVEREPWKATLTVGSDGTLIFPEDCEYTNIYRQCVPPDLRWLVAIPLYVLRFGGLFVRTEVETMGVLGIQGLRHELTEDQIDALVGYSMAEVLLVAAFIGTLSRVRVAVIKEELKNGQ